MRPKNDSTEDDICWFFFGCAYWVGDRNPQFCAIKDKDIKYKSHSEVNYNKPSRLNSIYVYIKLRQARSLSWIEMCMKNECVHKYNMHLSNTHWMSANAGCEMCVLSINALRNKKLKATKKMYIQNKKVSGSETIYNNKSNKRESLAHALILQLNESGARDWYNNGDACISHSHPNTHTQNI